MENFSQPDVIFKSINEEPNKYHGEIDEVSNKTDKIIVS